MKQDISKKYFPCLSIDQLNNYKKNNDVLGRENSKNKFPLNHKHFFFLFKFYISILQHAKVILGHIGD